MPPKMYPIWIVICAVILIIAMEILIRSPQIDMPLWDDFWFRLIRFQLLLLFAILAMRSSHAAGCRARLLNGMVCPWCDRNLSNDADTSHCSGCGKNLENLQLPIYWGSWWNLATRRSCSSAGKNASRTPTQATEPAQTSQLPCRFLPRKSLPLLGVLGALVAVQIASMILARLDVFPQIIRSAEYEVTVATVSVSTLLIMTVRLLSHDHHVRRYQGIVCSDCGYDLRESPLDGTCPECGKPYTHAQLRQYWLGHGASQS